MERMTKIDPRLVGGRPFVVQSMDPDNAEIPEPTIIWEKGNAGILVYGDIIDRLFLLEEDRYKPAVTAAQPEPMTREKILDAAKRCVCGDREEDYGTALRKLAGLTCETQRGLMDAALLAAQILAVEDAALAAKLDAYVKENPIPSMNFLTDGKGNVAFLDLPLGLYFIKQTNAAPGYAVCSPMLVTVPMAGTDGYVYDVNATPKTQVAKLTDVTIRKVWNTDASTKAAESVTVELLRNGAETIHIELEQTDGEATSHDVIAVIEGTEKADEAIVLTGHYDSLPVGPGAWDNATGSAALMGLYHYFLENAPKRTMYFVWCGSEEQGLLGSKAFIEQHAELVEKNIKFCFNFDMCGTVLGPNNIMITGDKNLEDFVDAFCREVGYSARTRVGVHSSDSAPFADKGIPGIGLSRGTKTAEIHTSYDTMFPLGEKALKANICFASKMISRVANSVILPVDTGMPENIKKELDKYFQRTAK